MGDKGTDRQETQKELDELERQLIEMGNMVESLFADSVVALMEKDWGAETELREEDYRAHESWLKIDKLCLDLLCNRKLKADQVRFVSAAIKIASALKRTADQSLHIGEIIRSFELESLPDAGSLAPVASMIELTQSMLGDVIEALVNHNAEEAAGLHLVSRELASLDAKAVDELGDAMLNGRVPVHLGTGLVRAVQRLQHVGNEVLDIANQLYHVYAGSPQQ